MSTVETNPMSSIDPQSCTLLIVDDEPAILEVVGDYLKKYDFQVIAVRHGETALKSARQDQPDLILLDVRLPGIDGFETCRRLKADERTREIPVIFMTVAAKTGDKVKGFEAGGVDYITKPFQQKEVLARVTAHLRIQALTRKLESAKETLEGQVAERTVELAQVNRELQDEIAEHKRTVETLRKSEAHDRRLFKRTQAALAETQALYRVTRSVSAFGNLPHVLQTVVDAVAEALPADRVTLVTFDLDAQQVTHFVKGGPGASQVVHVSFDELWNGLIGWVLREMKPALSPKGVPDPRETSEVQRRRAETNCGAIIVAPLRYRDKTLGTLTAINRPDERDFRQRDVRLMVSMADQAAVAIENARLYDAAQQEIAERKKVEEALNKRLVALTEPLETADVSFTDLFSLEDIQKIQDAFAKATNVASIITHPDGTPITRPSNFCRLCNDIIRKTEKGLENCFYSDAIIGRQNPTGPIVQPCLSGGLWDAGASITVGGKHIANWLIGQVKNEAIDEEKIIRYANEIGADEDEFRQALQEVPVMSNEQFQKVANALFLLANELSLKAYQNVQQARFIIERKQAEEELKQHRNHLEELVKERTAELTLAKDAAEEARRLAEAANQAKSTFLANMSHELRTPLNAVLGFSQLMTRDPNLTPRQRANLETIGRSGEHLLALINDVLDLSRIEAGRAEVQAESFDLWFMLLGLEEMFRLRAETKSLTLVFERDRNVPQYARADANKLRQVLINLLGNAVKFTRKGGVTLRVNYEDGDRVSGRLLFEVEDSGPGIAPQEMEAVFDPFVQAESGRKSRKGSGLGLPISRHFVGLMGGDMGVESEPGAGSLFRFDVPVQLVTASEVQPVQPTRRVVGLEPGQRATDSGLADSGLAGGGPADGGPYRLLIVEDTDSSRQLLVQLLQPLGFDVREAANGREAIDVWQQWKPHLIWMDIRMPVMDGLEASRRIKAGAGGRDVIIVALTASSFEEDREMILSQGCDDYVRKPYREADILDALTRHLGVRFVYEETEAPEREEREALELSELRSRLSTLPPDLLANLEHVAATGYTDQISDLVDQIRAHDAAVADALARLADDFEYVRIVALIQETGDQNE